MRPLTAAPCGLRPLTTASHRAPPPRPHARLHFVVLFWTIVFVIKDSRLGNMFLKSFSKLSVVLIIRVISKVHMLVELWFTLG